MGLFKLLRILPVIGASIVLSTAFAQNAPKIAVTDLA